MAGLKIFVSSTCIDLVEERNQVRNLIKNLGHEPILSDHNDIYYGNTEHTHVSCIRQVSNADMVVLLVGSRYGGVAIDDAIKEIDVNLIQDKINNKIRLQDLFAEMKRRTEESSNVAKTDPDKKAIKYGFSITHFEILRAIQDNIPIYAFVKDKVWNFNELYAHNRDMIESIKFPSIEKHQSKYLFEFIEILKHRNIGNSVFPYSNYLDIEYALKKQLAEMLKNLMDEQKNLKKESEFQQAHIDKLTDRFDDLKTAILSTLPQGNGRDIAKGLLKFRRLLGTILYMFRKVAFDKSKVIDVLSTSELEFPDFLKNVLNIIEFKTVDLNDDENDFLLFSGHLNQKALYDSPTTMLFLIRESGFFIFYNNENYQRLMNEWNDFILLSNDIRQPIVEALVDEDILMPTSNLRYCSENIFELIEKAKILDEEKRVEFIAETLRMKRFYINQSSSSTNMIA